MDWYFAEANQRLGPVDESEFRSLRVSGRIGANTLVWHNGMADWQPLSSVDKFSSPVPSPEGGFCTECGRAAAASEFLAFGDSRVCANCKDVFFQRVREQGVAATQGKYHYAGFWMRFLARFIDWLIREVVYLPLEMAGAAYGGFSSPRSVPKAQDPAVAVFAIKVLAGLGLLFVAEIFLNALYDGWFISHRGGTPGKLILGLQVIRPSGGWPSFGRAFGRYFAFLLSYMMASIGCIIAGFDPEKRSLHDRICDTRVIYKRG
jgi:uncharacterized RDD family membrane protein YckC